MKTEEEKLANEIIMAVKEVYNSAISSPLTTVDWEKGKRTIIKALKEYRKTISN